MIPVGTENLQVCLTPYSSLKTGHDYETCLNILPLLKIELGMNPNLGSLYQPSLGPQYNLLATPAAQSLNT